MDNHYDQKVEFSSPALESLKASDLKIRNEQPRGRLGNFGKIAIAGQESGAKIRKKDMIAAVNKKPSQSSVATYKLQPDSTNESSNIQVFAKEDGPESFASVSSYNTSTVVKQNQFNTPMKKVEQSNLLVSPTPIASKTLSSTVIDKTSVSSSKMDKRIGSNQKAGTLKGSVPTKTAKRILIQQSELASRDGASSESQSFN